MDTEQKLAREYVLGLAVFGVVLFLGGTYANNSAAAHVGMVILVCIAIAFVLERLYIYAGGR